MIQSGTQKPTDDETIESDPQPGSPPKPTIPEEDGPEIEETEEQPS